MARSLMNFVSLWCFCKWDRDWDTSYRFSHLTSVYSCFFLFVHTFLGTLCLCNTNHLVEVVFSIMLPRTTYMFQKTIFLLEKDNWSWWRFCMCKFFIHLTLLQWGIDLGCIHIWGSSWGKVRFERQVTWGFERGYMSYFLFMSSLLDFFPRI